VASWCLTCPPLGECLQPSATPARVRNIRGQPRKRRAAAARSALPIAERRAALPPSTQAATRPECLADGCGAADLWCIDSLKGSGWGRARDFVNVSAADAVCIQEHWLATQEACDEAAAAARGSKWLMHCPCAKTTNAGGASAGVAVLARAHFGLGTAVGVSIDATLATCIAVAWFPGIVRGGVSVVSVYLWTSQTPASSANRALIECLAEVIDA
jgi:hypothetical protein